MYLIRVLTWGDDEMEKSLTHTHTYIQYFTKIIRPRFLSRKDTSTIFLYF